jgi:CheY-like chemotaxis protein
MTGLLSGRGFEVACVHDAGEALDRIAWRPPTLVLLELVLPRMSGFELVRQLRREPATRALPLVALTAVASAGAQERALAAGFDGYLTKPIDTRAVRDFVDGYVHRCRPPSLSPAPIALAAYAS